MRPSRHSCHAESCISRGSVHRTSQSCLPLFTAPASRAYLCSPHQPVVRACVQRASQSCWQPCCASSPVRNAGSGVTDVADETLPSLLSRGVLHFAQETAPEFVPREVTIDAALNGSGRRSTRRYSRAACPMRRVWHRHPEESAPRHQFPQRALGTALPTPRRAYLRL